MADAAAIIFNGHGAAEQLQRLLRMNIVTGNCIKACEEMDENMEKKCIKINNIKLSPDKDVSYLEPIELTKESRIYDESDNVLAIEQRLELLGYFEEKPDKFFDEETKKALEMYQTFRKLPVTGTTNLETSLDLNSIDFENMAFSNEAQMNTALNYLKTGAFPQE